MPYDIFFALPAPSLFGLTFRRQLSLLKRTGFHGIELFLFPSVAKKVGAYSRLAKEAGMRLSLHQPWSYEESGGLLTNKILDMVGYLPKSDYAIDELIRSANGELFVGYCDYRKRFAELEKGYAQHPPVQFAFQTACTWRGYGAARTHSMSWRDFRVKVLSETSHKIVFDTFHILEWYFGAAGEALAKHSPEKLAAALLGLWEMIGPERIVEIHWNDFTGRTSGDGRDCLPGDGILAKGLAQLGKRITESGWSGTIVPELSPFLLFPYSEQKLVALRRRMQTFFSSFHL